MHTKPPTQRDKLSPKHVTSPPKKKFRTTFRSSVVDSKENEEQTYLDEIGGRGGKLNAIATQSNIEEKLEPNLN
jgi:hypothetical protein